MLFSVPTVLTALAGCSFDSANFRETRTMTLPAVTSAPVTVETANGSIAVSADAALTGIECSVEIKANTDERLKATQVVTEASPDGRLVFRVSWPGEGRKGSEGASFTIRMPSVNSPVLTTTNGAIKLAGATGPATLTTSNGALRVEGLAGALTAKTSNGAITASGVTGAVDAGTTNGAIELTDCAAAGDHVHAKSSNGSLTIRPAAAFKGRLDAQTSNGAIAVWLAETFPGSIDASTSNGTVTFDEFANVQIVKHGKTHRTLTFATPGPANTLKTSNGSVKVHKVP